MYIPHLYTDVTKKKMHHFHSILAWSPETDVAARSLLRNSTGVSVAVLVKSQRSKQHIKSHGFETSWDLTMRRAMGWWIVNLFHITTGLTHRQFASWALKQSSEYRTLNVSEQWISLYILCIYIIVSSHRVLITTFNLHELLWCIKIYNTNWLQVCSIHEKHLAQ